MIKEFKEFAVKGNLIDMAVAFVMGAAFGKVVSGFIQGMVMPLIGLVLGGIDLTQLKWIIQHRELGQDGTEVRPEVAVEYGAFITLTLDFLVVALVMFFLIKGINRLKKKQEKKAVEKAGPSPEQKLLTEIRDLLKR